MLITLPLKSQTVTIPAVNDPRFEQLPIIYVHGFNDDGRYWAINPETGGYDGTPGQYWDDLGIDSYVAQWWAPQGSPYANADDGWARLFTPEEIRGEVDGITPYNSRDPIGFFMSNFQQLFSPVTAPGFMIELYNNRIINNYNRNGVVEAHAENLVDVLRTTDGFGGKLSGHRQVNIITHSAGGLDTRAMLSILNESDNLIERERVANVIYTAPPFGGSNVAEIARLIWQQDIVEADIFSDPWFQSAIGEKSIAEFLRVYLKSKLPGNYPILVDRLNEIQESLFIAIATASGIVPAPSLDDITVDDLTSNPALANVVAAMLTQFRDVASYVVGFPGDPKVWEDLIPEQAVEHLNSWEANLHTRQFVTWGEGGAKLNATPTLSTAQNDYSTLANPSGLQRLDDDNAVSNVSARVLTGGPNGYMEELAGYPDLDHGGVLLDLPEVGRDWANTLLTPVTEMILTGDVKHEDQANRYFVVGASTTFEFRGRSRQFNDSFGNLVLVRARGYQIRVGTQNMDQEMEFSDWVRFNRSRSLTFGELIEQYDLEGEPWFKVEWRATKSRGGVEAIRSANFTVDDLAPSIVTMDMIHVGETDSDEIYGSMNRSMDGRRAISNKFSSVFDKDPLFEKLQNKPLADWIIRDQSDKILFLQFDQSAKITYWWNDVLNDPQTIETVNQNLSFTLADVLNDGLNTLYYRTEDNLGNESNIMAVTILVDNQPPAIALNYQPPRYLDWVTGPDTPLSVIAEDLGTGSATGSVSVPGLSSLPVNATFTLGDSNIEQNGAFGVFVPVTVTARDAVGNSTTETFEVYYDWTPPKMDLQFVGESSSNKGSVILQSDGSYLTTKDRVHIELTVTTNAAGVQPLTWQLAGTEQGQVRSGGPFIGQSFPRGFAYGGSVNLFDGVNTIVVSTTDDYGQPASYTLVVEKVDQLFGDVERPIEIIGEGGAEDVEVSDDGSAFVYTKDDHIYVWRNGITEQVDLSESGEAANDDSRSPEISGNGRYVYFASEATNLTDDNLSGLNLFVKDLNTGEVALLSRNSDGDPVNMNSIFGRLSFTKNTATSSGRYIFFHDRYQNYIADASNNGFDIYAVDLDPDVNGDFFDSSYDLRRVSLAPGGAEGTGGGTPTVSGGSRYPSVSAVGLYLTFESTHTNLFSNDTNDQPDVFLTNFGSVDSQGSIDFTGFETIPLNTNSNGTINSVGARAPGINPTGEVVVFTTRGNLAAGDTNNNGVDKDVYSSVASSIDWKQRSLSVMSVSSEGESDSGSAVGRPSVALADGDSDVRTAFVSDMDGIVDGDNNSARDLFVRSGNSIEAINWTIPETPAGPDLGITGGISADGKWAWWNTVYKYPDLNYGGQNGRRIHRRHIDPEPPVQPAVIVQHPSGRSVYLGQDVSFSVQATGYPAPEYQWYFNEEAIDGATQPVYTVTNVTLTDRGEYRVEAINELGSAVSNSASLTVTSLTPLISAQPA
ncbi:MAG TPA: immunoglobulin domain-containing protein, partial [Balneolaceae bacterium]|nr:immunoglobulin domain-containing protein [Balneolaceae bacterium]